MTRRQRLLIAVGETPRLTAQVQSSVVGDMITFVDKNVTGAADSSRSGPGSAAG